MQFEGNKNQSDPVNVGEKTESALNPKLLLLWLGAFLYALVLGLTLQKLILPLIPGMHAGHGLMFDDAINFHQNAVAMASSIRTEGWGMWELMPYGRYTANVGILAAIYAFFSPEPALFLPLNAAFHALGALAIVLLASLLSPVDRGFRNGLFAAFLFLAFPSALVWYGQNHKDAFLIAGYLLSLYAFLRSFNRTSLRDLWRDALILSLGLALVAIMRPHMVAIYTLAFGCAWLALLAWKLIRPGTLRTVSFHHALAMLVIGGVLAWVAPIENEMVTWEAGAGAGAGAVPTNMRLENWAWERSAVIPGPVDHALEKISAIRVHFIASGELVGAGSLIDADVKPQNALEVIAYLPKAALIGVFSPFPSFWVERLSLPRVVGSIETLIFYLLFPGVLALLVRRPSKELFACLIASLAVITVLSFVSPNIGTLHRVRYGQLFVFALAGCLGWGLLIRSWIETSGHGITSLRGSSPGVEDAPAINPPSGTKAVGAGLIVTMVTMLGLLGLLIRDLLLINRSGFGHGLDSYYMAIMLPMLFMNILAAPLGDALTASFVKLEERKSIQALLSAVSTFTLILFSVISAGLLMLSSEIFTGLFATGRPVEVIALFPIALLLFLFSGIIVAGNSLVNALGRPVLAAVGQLSVPVAVIVAIMLANDSVLIRSAMIGMAVGQLINLVILFLVVNHCGYKLLPGSMSALWHERKMLANCKWLVFCALVTGLIIPINYWFAGQIGVGAVSTWAIGSKLVQMSSLLGAALMTAVFVPYMTRLVSTGVKAHIRGNLFVSLILGGWGSAVVIAMVFIFAEPLVFAAASSVEREAAMQLVGILKLGALQLPYVITTILLVKLCAVSAVSRKAVAAASLGLVVNIILNCLWVPAWGVLGLALAWTVSSIFATALIMLLTREQSHLSTGELLCISATWLVLFGFAAAMQTHSAPLALAVLIAAGLTIGLQFKMLSAGKQVVDP